jgi:hypothetical protein
MQMLTTIHTPSTSSATAPAAMASAWRYVGAGFELDEVTPLAGRRAR